MCKQCGTKLVIKESERGRKYWCCPNWTCSNAGAQDWVGEGPDTIAKIPLPAFAVIVVLISVNGIFFFDKFLGLFR